MDLNKYRSQLTELQCELFDLSYQEILDVCEPGTEGAWMQRLVNDICRCNAAELRQSISVFKKVDKYCET